MEYRKRDYHLFQFIYFIRFFADAMFYGYTSLYLTSLGLNEGIIGTIASITTITCLVVNPFWSMLAKNNRIIRILLLILSLIEGTAIIIYGNVSATEGIMLLTAMAAIAAAPFYNMLDGCAEGYCEANGKDYAKIRIMGSFAYVCAVLLCSFLIEKIGYTITFIIAGATFIVVGFLTFLLPKTDKKQEEKKRDYKKILTNKWFLLYCMSYIFIVSLTNVLDTYNSIFFTKEIGLTVQQYSYVYVGMLVTETVTLFLAGKLLKKVKFTYIFFTLGLVLASRMFLLSMTTLPVGFLIAFSCLRGIAWGLCLFVHIKIVAKLVGIENLTTAIILFGVASGLFSFLLNNAAGYLIESLGYAVVFRIFGGIVFIFSVIYVLIFTIKDKKSVEMSEK